MKQKGMIVLLALLTAFLILPLRAAAAEEDAIRKFAGTEALRDALPEGMDHDVVEDLLKEESPSAGIRGLWSLILSAMTPGLKSSLRLLGGVVALVLLGGLGRAASSSFSPNSKGIFDLILLFALVLFTYHTLEGSLQLTLTTTEMVRDFMLVALPILTLIKSMEGSLLAASCQYSGAMLMLSSVSALVSGSLLTVTKGLFALHAAGSFSESKISPFFQFAKKWVKILLCFAFLLVTAVLGIKNLLAVAKDSLTQRSLRFAAGNLIPVVGSFVGESAKTLTASLKWVKTESGVLCLLILLFLILRPLLSLLFARLALSLGETFAQILGEDTVAAFLKGFLSLQDLLMGILIAQLTFFLFYLALFLQSGGAV